MKRIARALLGAVIAVALPAAAGAQQVILQGGAQGPGRAPMYVGQPSSQPVVVDSGSAAGGGPGAGLAELLIVSRAANGVTTAPYANSGNGPFAAHDCMFDAPTTNRTGYHFLCFDPNAQGGGLMAYGAAAGAAQLPFTFNLNGFPVTFPTTGVGGSVALECGEFIAGHGVAVDDNNCLIDAGGPAAGSVNVGSALHLGYYAVDGSAISQVPNLLTSASGTPLVITPPTGQSAILISSPHVTANASAAINITNGTIDTSANGSVGYFLMRALVNSVGTNSGNIRLLQLHLQPGYTGSGITSGMEIGNEAQGTQTMLVAGLTEECCNTGATIYSDHGTVVTAGDRIAVYAYSGGTTGASIAGFFRAGQNTAAVPRMSIGVLATAISDNSNIHPAIGGQFVIGRSSSFLTLTDSAALIADNNDQTLSNVQIWRSGNVNVAAISPAGGLNLGAANLSTNTPAGTILPNIVQFPYRTSSLGWLQWGTGGGAIKLGADANGNLFMYGGNATLTGTNNVAIGASAAANLTAGGENVVLGLTAGPSLLTGSRNVLIGRRAGLSYTGAESSNTIIGGCGGTVGVSNSVLICDGDGVARFDYGDSNAGQITLGAPFRNVTLAAAAPSVSAGQVGLGGTVAAATSCGSLAGAAGCLVINVAGSGHFIPYY